jgi:hypothetical protein
MINKKIAFTAGTVTILVTFFFALMNLNEWYRVAIMNDHAGYPFGGEGPLPYYYKTASLYATVTFIWGALFLANLGYAMWSTRDDRRRAMMIGFVVSILLISIMFIHGRIGI